MSKDVAVVRGSALTPMQSAYVAAILEGRSEREALDLAGYDQTTKLHTVAASQAVQAAIRQGHKSFIAGELSSKARKTMESLLDEKVPAATRYSAAKWILERGEDDRDEDDMAPSEMSGADLDRFIARAERALAEQPAIIDVTPNSGALPKG